MTKTKIQVMVRTTVLIPQATKDALDALALKGHRSFSNEVRLALEEHAARNYKASA